MKYLLLLLIACRVVSVHAQDSNPVSWSHSYEHVDGDTYELHLTATMKPGWYIYSQHINEGGPIPTSFFFDAGEHYELSGTAEEQSDHRKSGHDEIFDMEVTKYAESVTFVQRAVLNDPSQPITGYLEYMTCDDEQCLPPREENFSIGITPASNSPASAPEPGPEKIAALPSADGAVSNPYRAGNAPVEWTAELQRNNDDTYELIFQASIDKGWYTYTQFLEDDGPVPTFINFLDPEQLTRVGDPQETGSKRQKEYDSNFEMELIKFKESAFFQQKIQLKAPVDSIEGYVEYMICNDSQCLPPAEIPFTVYPEAMRIVLGAQQEAPLLSDFGEEALDVAAMYQLPKPDLSAPAAQCGEIETVKSGAGYWNIFFLGFVGGLLALLTPCVFPMIPLTVSFFTKSSDKRRKGIRDAVIYGAFILLVYLLLSVPFHLMEGVSAGILNDISTNVYLNVAFFLIFLFFAFSFFGYYELTLPASWTNKASAAEGIGGILGIFFMAVTLALVSFSCTGPILGSLLAGALTAEGGAWQLSTGMAGFGLALALPFAIFAAFPSMMNALPRSGGWLQTVKVTLGFLELALALKFLSNADLVKHWGILKIELFLGLWILIFLGLSLYLFGILKFAHDTPVKKLSGGRIASGALSLAFVIYLASGFLYNERAGTYRSLKLLSGLAPPASYSFFHPSDCPQNLNCFKDLEEGLAYAREVNKPVMIDFTGYACVNCRKMEEHVWPEGPVYGTLKDDYVLISLYVDDKKPLPPNQQQKVDDFYGSRDNVIRTYGHKWQYFQDKYFGAVAQPYYVLITPDGQLLNNPVGYTPDPEEYAQFLECGKEAYQSLVNNRDSKSRPLGAK